MSSATSAVPLEEKPLTETERIVDTFIAPSKMAMSPKQAEKLDQLPPEQRAAQMETIVKWNRTIAYVFPIISLIIAAIVSGVLLATFNFGLGAELKFKHCMAVTLYSWLPGVIKAIIAIIAVSIGGGEGFIFQNPVASNPSGLVDPSSHFLYSIAISLDLFSIWMVVLMGIGYSCLTRVKRGTCMGVVFAWWAIVVLAGAGMGAIFA